MTFSDGIANRLGLLSVSGKMEKETASVLVDMLKMFIRGGGTVDLDDWLSLDDETRVALATAGDEVFVERLTRLAEGVLEASGAGGEGGLDTAIKQAAEEALNNL